MKNLPQDFYGTTGIYKPVGPSSHNMIYRARHWTGVKKIGHAGTLDPLAEGVLVIAIGREHTKQLSKFLTKEKEYVTEIFLGQTSTTDDSEGKKTIVSVQKPSEIFEISQTLEKFIGEIWQTPPLFSAVKINGQEAYKYARKGEHVLLKPRKRQVKEIELLEYSWPLLKLRVITGSGVYIRALARDIGGELGVGGYMHRLIRTKVAQYTLEECYQLPN